MITQTISAWWTQLASAFCVPLFLLGVWLRIQIDIFFQLLQRGAEDWYTRVCPDRDGCTEGTSEGRGDHKNTVVDWFLAVSFSFSILWGALPGGWRIILSPSPISHKLPRPLPFMMNIYEILNWFAFDLFFSISVFLLDYGIYFILIYITQSSTDYNYLKLATNGGNAEIGSNASNLWHPSYSARRWASMTNYRWRTRLK